MGGSTITEKLLFSPQRPPEELYYWIEDHWQVRNLAADGQYQTILNQMRQRLDQWMDETQDFGAEDVAMYDSDMAVYLGGRAGTRNEDASAGTRRNIELMKRWADEGK